MTLHTPVFIQPSTGDPDLTFTGQELRVLLQAQLAVNSGIGGSSGEEGIVMRPGAGTGQAVQRGAGANFSVDVAGGKMFIFDDDVTNGGVAMCWSDATVNVPTPSAPGSGTDLHRIIYRLRNKAENGTWTTYDFVPDIVADTTHAGTLPAEPNSAITIAAVSIAAGQASVTTANITDYRQMAGMVPVFKAADTARTSAALSNDPDLQLTQLQANATYWVEGLLIYTAGGGTDFQFGWTLQSGTIQYAQARVQTGSGTPPATGFVFGNSDVVQAGGLGTSTPASVIIRGVLTTTAAPAFAKLRWSANTNTGFNAVLKSGSWLRARRMG